MRVKYRSACNAKSMKAILAAILQSTFYKVMSRCASASRTNGITPVATPTNPQVGQTGLPLLLLQRIDLKYSKQSFSLILAIFLTDIVLALDERRKCWDIFKPFMYFYF